MRPSRALAVALASPQFLYLAEPVQDGERRPLSAAELATRLSYFLWGGPPDATLRDLAARGELMKPEVLAEQTTRLLDDPRFDNSTKLAMREFIHSLVASEEFHTK